MSSKSHDSLVKYDSPKLINSLARETSSSAAKNKQSSSAAKTGASTEDILNSILPPREWTDDGQLWVQYVSSVPATRHDVVTLQEELDKKLLQRKARETGICPIREELYAQCFDELIRQITINCAERGLLLLRIRDEIRMTIASYQALYESSIAYGMRKALQSQQSKNKLVEESNQVKRECSELEKEVNLLQDQISELQQNHDKKRADIKQKHEQEVQTMKEQNDALKQELQKLLTIQPKKK
mmetsp:Transcript_34515/g.56205  ORF Transcript_34515/g.56205 Transcript_34515/m.56205 type:complete len:242 (+) Transcript_34515:102-827(+)